VTTRHSFPSAISRIRVNDLAESLRTSQLMPCTPADDEDEEVIPPPPALADWDPPFCGDSFMVIARDGTWLHEGQPIRRTALVRLFASILRREGAGYVLVTPGEKLSITVEDAPFLAVETWRKSAAICLRTNMGETVTAGAGHPLRFCVAEHGGLVPYVLVREGLWARLTRTVSLQCLEAIEERTVDGAPRFGIASGGAFFVMPEESADAAR
jgi:uncharacterized protein